MNLKLIPAILLTLFSFTAHSQEAPADTVIVPLAESSKIIFTIRNRSDLHILRHYNFQELFDDILQKLEDSEGFTNDSSGNAASTTREEDWSISSAEKNDSGNESNDEDDDNDSYGHSDDDEEEEQKWQRSRRGRIGQTWQSYNIDLGTNNYLAEDQFPDASELYSVRPWGSWYLAGNSVQRTRLGKNIFVEWGLGVSWYSFKFQENNILVQKDELGVLFSTDSRDVEFIKSKLSATFINASLVPVLDFGDHSRKSRIWDGNGSGFRFGVGPYVGYRISSKTKLVYEENGDREKEKDRDNFHLNNLRYGFRLQLGIRSTDLFVNYDMNELFAKDKGPKLNAISFGLIF
ncbi:MAG: hypothetical protein WD824_11015 [Cyclobacteriaceae bacterium]